MNMSIYQYLTIAIVTGLVHSCENSVPFQFSNHNETPRALSQWELSGNSGTHTRTHARTHTQTYTHVHCTHMYLHTLKHIIHMYTHI